MHFSKRLHINFLESALDHRRLRENTHIPLPPPIYYYTPLPLNLANNNTTTNKNNSTNNKQASISPFRSAHHTLSTLHTLLYSSQPRA